MATVRLASWRFVGGVAMCGATCWGQSCTPQWLSGGIPSMPSGAVYATVMWDRDGAGPLPPALVAGGSFTLAGSTAVSNLALWDGVAWSDVGGGVSGTIHGATAVNALAVMPNGDLVVGGAFDSAGVGGGSIVAPCIARYNGAAWAPMGNGLPQLGSLISSLTIRSNGDLVALGGYPFVNLDNTIAGPLAVWNDLDPRWKDFGNGVPPPAIGAIRTVYALAGGDLVIGGLQGAAGNSAAWRWSSANSQWQSFGVGVVGGTAPLNQVFSVLELANGDIVLAGNFTNAGGVAVNSIARWNGTQFSPLGTGITYASQPFLLRVAALAQMPNGDIVAGGNFDLAGGNSGGRIARWDGAGWARLPQGAGDIVWSLLRTPETHNELIIGGAYNFAGGSFSNKRIARYADSPIPWAARHPQALPSVAHDGTVTLSATAVTGIVGVSYQWRRNGVAIVDGAAGASAGGGVVAGSSGALASPTNGAAVTMTITGARLSDSGSYSVVFSNSCGSGESLAVAVAVAGPPCPADYNHDGFLDGFDYDDFVTAFETGVGLAGDFNQDGFVDGFDYDDFVAAFEAGC